MTLETLSRPPVVDSPLVKAPITPLHYEKPHQAPILKKDQILEILNINGGIIQRDTLIQRLYPNGDNPPRALERAISDLRKDLKPSRKTIRYRGGKNPQFEIVDASNIVFPNGEEIAIRGRQQRKILQALIDAGKTGITAQDIYGENTPTNAANLDSLVRKLRKRTLQNGYAITGKTLDGKTRYVFGEEIEKAIRLSNGILIENLSPQERSILQHLDNEDIPVYMSSLMEQFTQISDPAKAKDTISRALYDLRKKLQGKAEIKLSTKYRTPNPAYYLSMDSMGEKKSSPFVKSDDAYIKQRIDKITGLLETQKNNKPLTLTDEINAQLNNELQQLHEEMAARKKRATEQQAVKAPKIIVPPIVVEVWTGGMDDLKSYLMENFRVLSRIQLEVLEARTGVVDGNILTHEEIANVLRITTTKVKQIEGEGMTALWKARINSKLKDRLENSSESGAEKAS